MRTSAPRRIHALVWVTVLVAAGPSTLSCQDLEPSGQKSPGAALALSAAGTAVPMGIAWTTEGAAVAGLFLGGLSLGPALGYVYAGEIGHGLAHAGIRIGVLAGTYGGVSAICSAGECGFLFGGGDPGATTAAAALGLAGLAVTTGLALWDIVTVDNRVRDRSARRLRLAVRPAYFRGSGTGVVATWKP